MALKETALLIFLESCFVFKSAVISSSISSVKIVSTLEI